jgi:hypothetical protein
MRDSSLARISGGAARDEAQAKVVWWLLEARLGELHAYAVERRGMTRKPKEFGGCFGPTWGSHTHTRWSLVVASGPLGGVTRIRGGAARDDVQAEGVWWLLGARLGESGESGTMAADIEQIVHTTTGFVRI